MDCKRRLSGAQKDMKSRTIYVARDGAQIGQYETEEMLSLLETGVLRETDYCYSADIPEWTVMKEYLPLITPPKYAEAKEAEITGEPRRSRRPRAERQNNFIQLAGWVACLLTVALLVGAGFWIASLYAELQGLKDTATRAQDEIAAITKDNRRLLFAGGDTVESGVAMGRLLLRNAAGKRVPLAAAQVSLFPRRAIEDYLDSMAKEAKAEGLPPEAFNSKVKSRLPFPLASTVSDSDGRFKLKVPDKGDYVIFAHQGQDLQLKLWFVSYDTADELNFPLQLDDSNMLTQPTPGLMVAEGR